MAKKRLPPKKRAAIKRTKQILGIPTSSKDARGFEGEQIVDEALHYLKRKKRITSFSRVVKFSGDDLSGKDFIVTLLDGGILPLQVKTYYNAEEINSYYQRGIWPVIIQLFDEEGQRKPYAQLYREAKRKVSRVISDFEKTKEEAERVTEERVAEKERTKKPAGRISRFFSRLLKILLGK